MPNRTSAIQPRSRRTCSRLLLVRNRGTIFEVGQAEQRNLQAFQTVDEVPDFVLGSRDPRTVLDDDEVELGEFGKPLFPGQQFRTELGRAAEPTTDAERPDRILPRQLLKGREPVEDLRTGSKLGACPQ